MKTVWVQAHKGSNPFPSAKSNSFELFMFRRVFFYSLSFETSCAEVLIYSDDNNVLLSKNAFGKGNVYFLNAPIEYAYSERSYPENSSLYKIYKEIISPKVEPLISDSKLATFNYDFQDRKGVFFVNYNDYKTFKLNRNIKIIKIKNAEIQNGSLTLTKDYSYVEYMEE